MQDSKEPLEGTAPSFLIPNPPLVEGTLDIQQQETIQSVLTAGTRMTKIPNKTTSKPESRLIKVDLLPLQLTWESKKKKGVLSSCDFHSIRELRLGQNTKAFDLHGRFPDQEDRAFSIIYVAGGEYKTLNLVAPTKEECQLWVYGLNMLLTQSRMSDDLAHFDVSMASFLKKMWNTMDTKQMDSLNLDGVTLLLKRLNIKLSEKEVKSAFKNAKIDKLDSINFDCFERLYRILRFRPEISEIFHSIAKTEENASFLTWDEFQEFLVCRQKVSWTPERMQEVYNKYTNHQGQMTMDHFSAFLISANNSIFRKEHLEIYQDLSQPLNKYYINSSHNTYLLGDQLTSESSVEGYIRALQKGCRCIEMDCWDGPNGFPLIYHGLTLTSRIAFKDAVEAISKYAFVSSDYPLIISLEVHCSIEQQAIMAELFIKTFGESLVLVKTETNQLPSPESLKRRILLKGKVTEYIATRTESEEDVYVSEPSPLKGSSNSSPTLSPRVSKKQALNPKLCHMIVYCKKIHFSQFPLQDHSFDEMFSFSERKSFALIQKHPKEYMAYNRRFLTRVYPSATRVKSTNFDPIPHWLAGCQMVAMNYQTYDKYFEMNQALFASNGKCGYILKPNYSRSQPVTTCIKLLVISAQQLPKPKDSVTSNIIDPFVDIELLGEESLKYRTRSIPNNGFNPMWKEKFEFLVSSLDLSFLRFQVSDASHPIGSFSIRCCDLEQGYRHVPLYNWKGEFLPFSTLFIRIKIKDK